MIITSVMNSSGDNPVYYYQLGRTKNINQPNGAKKLHINKRLICTLFNWSNWLISVNKKKKTVFQLISNNYQYWIIFYFRYNNVNLETVGRGGQIRPGADLCNPAPPTPPPKKRKTVYTLSYLSKQTKKSLTFVKTYLDF